MERPRPSPTHQSKSARSGPATGDATGSSALVIAHPGHELRVYGWLHAARPRVFVMTDGSGRSGRSRLGSTNSVLDQIGLERGGIFGRLTDSQVYSALLGPDFRLFIDLAKELGRYLVEQDIELVAGDAAEGYNPVHDACRLVINAALALARSAGNRRIANFEFPVSGRAEENPEALPSGALCHRLDQEVFVRKIAAAFAYSELSGEVNRLVGESGVEALRTEWLYPVLDQGGVYELGEELPFYELYGEKQVQAGYYQQVIRYRQHLVPLAEALQRSFTRRD